MPGGKFRIITHFTGQNKRLVSRLFNLYHFLIQLSYRFIDQFFRTLNQAFDEWVKLSALVEEKQSAVEVEECV